MCAFGFCVNKQLYLSIIDALLIGLCRQKLTRVAILAVVTIAAIAIQRLCDKDDRVGCGGARRRRNNVEKKECDGDAARHQEANHPELLFVQSRRRIGGGGCCSGRRRLDVHPIIRYCFGTRTGPV